MSNINVKTVNLNEGNLNEGLGSNESVNIKSKSEPGLFNQALSTVIGMKPKKSFVNKLGELRNQATSVIANQTGKAGNQAKELAGQAANAYGQARNQVMNGVGKAQNRGQNIIGQVRNTATATAKTVQNTATSTLATATNQAQKRVENLKELHSNATGTTKVIKAIRKNGKKTRRRIEQHMNRLAKQVETSCGKARNNSITVGGKRKSRKTKAKGKNKRKTKDTKKRMTKRKIKRYYRKRKTAKKSRS